MALQVQILIMMRETRLGNAYHIERALAVRQGIPRYPCGCEKCHGFKTQTVEVVETHHIKYGRDQRLNEPLLVSCTPNYNDDNAVFFILKNCFNLRLHCHLD